jgi:hypothetical protein
MVEKYRLVSIGTILLFAIGIFFLLSSSPGLTGFSIIETQDDSSFSLFYLSIGTLIIMGAILTFFATRNLKH